MVIHKIKELQKFYEKNLSSNDRLSFRISQFQNPKMGPSSAMQSLIMPPKLLFKQLGKKIQIGW